MATLFPLLISVLLRATIAYEYISQAYSWANAEAQCNSLYGTNLATINNAIENADVFNTCLSTAGLGCWIGLYGGGWKWIETGAFASYFSWGAVEPNGDGTCVDIMSDGNWNDYICNGALPAVCNSPVPTATPTKETMQPTTNPTIDPTLLPTNVPTAVPTSAPTKDCTTRGLIYAHNWDNSSESQKPFSEYSIQVKSTSLEVTFDIELEYIGYSTVGNVYGTGTAYAIDFQAFDTTTDVINHPGTCANRISSSYSNASWTQYWKYSPIPYVNGHLSSTNYLAYPPSDTWNLSQSVECTRIKYTATFGWDELRGCTNYNGTETLLNIAEDDNWINMSGKLYVDMVSPFSMNSETNYYLAKQIIESDTFYISVSTSVHALSSANVNVFTISPFTNYRLYDSGQTKDGGYTMTIFTEIINHMYFTSVQLLSFPKYTWKVSALSDGNCIYPKLNICHQFWEINASSLLCPVSFAGTFFLKFNVSCNPEINGTQECSDYIAAFGTAVVLNFDFRYEDNFNCSLNSELGIVQMSATQIFYKDAGFAALHGENDKFIRGIDHMYIEIQAAIPSTVHSTFQVSLVNVWLCTCNSTIESQMSISQTAALTTGCFDTSIVDAGSLASVVVAGVSRASYDANIIAENSTSIVRFSFLTPNWTGRAKVFVQSQIKISLVDAVPGRRRLVADSGNVQYTLHILGSVSIADESGSEPPTNSETIASDNANNLWISITLGVGISFVGILCLMLALGLYLKKKWNAMKSELASVTSMVNMVRAGTKS